MATLFEFSSARFDPADEPENPINPMAGYAVLDWIAEQLAAAGFEVSRPPGEEDWGWYIDAHRGEERWLVGATDQSEIADGRVDWMIQVEPRVPFLKRLFGRGPKHEADALERAVERILSQSPDVDALEIRRSR